MLITVYVISSDSEMEFHKSSTLLKLRRVELLWNSISESELQDVSCHMGSHSVTCHPTQQNTARLNPSHTGRYSIYPPWTSWPRWLRWFTRPQTVTHPSTNRLSWWLHRLSVGLVIERSLVCLAAGALSSQLGQLSLPSLRVGKSSIGLHGWG